LLTKTESGTYNNCGKIAITCMYICHTKQNSYTTQQACNSEKSSSNIIHITLLDYRVITKLLHGSIKQISSSV